MRALLGIQLRGAQHVDLDDPWAYSEFSAMTLRLAAFPHAMRHPHAGAVVIKSELDSWGKSERQGRDYPQDRNWKHAEVIDKISVGPPGTFRRVWAAHVFAVRHAVCVGGVVRSVAHCLRASYGAQ